MRRIWIWLPVVPLLLVGCGNDGQQHDKGKLPAAEASQGAENQSMSSSASDASPAESGQELNSAKQSVESSVDYTREIAFDIEAIQDPLVNEEIKTSLRDALEGNKPTAPITGLCRVRKAYGASLPLTDIN